MVHPLLSVVDSLESALDEAGSPGGIGASALSAAELRDVARRAWAVVRRVQGAVLLPVVAETAERQLYRHEPNISASSTRDLITGWLRCDPRVAGQLLETANRTVRGGFRATGQALAAGEIDLDHARAIVRSVRSLPAGVMSETDYRRTESTMLDTARSTDPGVTAAAGARLLEVIAPDAAQEHLDRKAERDRKRAEESRWFEVTGIGIAGCKELRLRAESETIDGLMRIITGLTQPTTVDQPAAEHTTQTWGAPGTAGTNHEQSKHAAEAEQVMSSPQPAGLLAEGGLCALPIERRRADAAVEVIEAISRPDLLDELTPTQLRRLANELDSATAGEDAGPVRDLANLPNTNTENTNTENTSTGGTDTQELDGPADIDAALAAMADTSQITTDVCDTMVDEEQDGREQPALPDSRAAGRRAAGGRGAANRAAAGGGRRVRGERPTLVVLVPYDIRDDRRPTGPDRDSEGTRGGLRSAEVNSTGSPPRLASATEIERLACQATMTPVWLARGVEPVTVAAPSRFFRGKQLAALIARDRGCAFPGVRHEAPWIILEVRDLRRCCVAAQ